MIRTALSVCLSCQNNEKLPLWSQEVLIWYQILYGHGFLSWFEATKLCVPRQSLTFFGLSVFNSVQFSDSVVSDFLRPHESQDTRPSCPLPTPRVHSDSRPSSQWCHPAISSSVIPFSSCPQSLPASGSFPMSQLFAWGGQSIGVSALASFLPKNTQGWSPLEWTAWISLQSKGLSGVFSNTTVQKHQFSHYTLLILFLIYYNLFPCTDHFLVTHY